MSYLGIHHLDITTIKVFTIIAFFIAAALDLLFTIDFISFDS